VCLRRFMIVFILPSHHGKHDHASSLDHFTGTPPAKLGAAVEAEKPSGP